MYGINTEDGILRQDTAATKARILTIAEKLFASQGIENVTLAEINQKSGQKNRSALQYHFGGKNELIDTILHKHLLIIDKERNILLDQFETEGISTTRSAAEAIVLPLANRLNDKEGGADYIRIMSQLIGKETFPHLHLSDLESHFSSQRMWKHAQKVAGDFPPTIQFTRTILILSTLFHGLASYATTISSKKEVPASITNQLFIADLIDSIEALLEKKPTRETLEILP